MPTVGYQSAKPNFNLHQYRLQGPQKSRPDCNLDGFKL